LLTKDLDLQHHIINCKSTAGRRPFQKKCCSGIPQQNYENLFVQWWRTSSTH